MHLNEHFAVSLVTTLLLIPWALLYVSTPSVRYRQWLIRSLLLSLPLGLILAWNLPAAVVRHWTLLPDVSMSLEVVLSIGLLLSLSAALAYRWSGVLFDRPVVICWWRYAIFLVLLTAMVVLVPFLPAHFSGGYVVSSLAIVTAAILSFRFARLLGSGAAVAVSMFILVILVGVAWPLLFSGLPKFSLSLGRIQCAFSIEFLLLIGAGIFAAPSIMSYWLNQSLRAPLDR
jgi:hypothetical protein